jgi:peptidoglycan/LPS O-acetylase OafA/YrhL
MPPEPTIAAHPGDDVRHYAFIDALRGIAILGVILVHASIAVPPSNADLRQLMAGGARGVQLFYIASALTLCLSWAARAPRERFPIRNFYLRRVFRIVPMFWLAIVAYLLIYGLEPRYYAPNGIEWYYVPLTALFLNGFHPETLTSVVPGGWSIVVEMTFYLVLPLLLMYVRSTASLISLVVFSILLERATGYMFRTFYLPMYPAEQQYLVDNFVFLNFFGQFPVFAIGLLAYRLLRTDHPWRTAVLASAPIAFVAWLGWRALNGHTLVSALTLHVQMGAAFAWLAIVLADHPTRLLVNPLTTWIGKRSYSMYLSHFAVLELFAVVGLSRAFGIGNSLSVLHFIVVVVVTAGVSAVCHLLIEKPGIEAGRQVIARGEAQRAAVAIH